VRPFNPLNSEDQKLFRALLAGEHSIHGFSNRELRKKLHELGALHHADERKEAARVSRHLARLHFHGLVAKFPRSRRWRVSARGQNIMTAALKLRHDHFASAISPPQAKAAA
jgi:hypothetical protein